MRGREKGWHHTEAAKEKIREARREWWVAKKKAEAYAEGTADAIMEEPPKKGFWARLGF